MSEQAEANARYPLEGIRVLDFCWVWAGPYCTMQLAHMGADVIRIESRKHPCVTRYLPPWADMVPGPNRAFFFNQYNLGKRSLTLDLKAPAAREIVYRLAARSDVVTCNFAHGVIERLGFSYDRLREIKPDLIMISLSGYGDSGTYRDYVAYGPAQVPLSGFSMLTGYREFPPMHTAISYPDPSAGIHGAFAVLAALYHRGRTGEGQYIELSQWDSSMQLLGDALLGYAMNGSQPERDGNRDPHMAPHGLFRCKDPAESALGMPIDRWVAIVGRNDTDWAGIARVLGRPELAADPRFATVAARKRNEDELERLIGEWTAGLEADEVVERLQSAGIAAAVCADNKFLAEDPHLNARGYFCETPHPEIGVRKHAGIPWLMSRTPCAINRPAPLLGEHTEEILTQLLGMTAQEIAQLKEQGVFE